MTFVKDGLAHFAIDTKASLFTVQAFASGTVAVVAHSPKFAVRNFVGEMEFGIETMENASLQLMINIGSLEAGGLTDQLEVVGNGHAYRRFHSCGKTAQTCISEPGKAIISWEFHL
jgi:hypothetical protein